MYELATFCRMHKDHLDSRLLLLSPKWPSVFNPLESSRLSDILSMCRTRQYVPLHCEEELALLTGFRLADVECAKPADRAIVLDAIRSEWGSEAAFEDFVRTQLPPVLAASKQRYSRQVAIVAGRAFGMAFGG